MILDEIVKKTKERVKALKQEKPLEIIKEEAMMLNKETGFPFEKALKKPGLSFICEVKKASPSKGIITGNFPYTEIAMEYEQAGASAISCLTEPYYFKGSNEYLKEIVKKVNIPVLRKDFTVDEYMIYEAKTLGSSAILLICAVLSDEELIKYVKTAHSLGMSALIEAHTEMEVERALKSGSKIIGVNNRDLKTFNVDINTSIKYRKLVPKEFIYVSESGIKGKEDTERLYHNGTDAVLIGELLMKSRNKKNTLKELGLRMEQQCHI